MEDAPCGNCTKYMKDLDAPLDPHAYMERIKFRQGGWVISPEAFAEFFRCDVCKMIFLRNLNPNDPQKRWDWVGRNKKPGA